MEYTECYLEIPVEVIRLALPHVYMQIFTNAPSEMQAWLAMEATGIPPVMTARMSVDKQNHLEISVF